MYRSIWTVVSSSLAFQLGSLPTTVAAQTIRFDDIRERSGIAFVHENGAFGMKYPIEIMGGGCALLDYDADGDLDVYFVNGAHLSDSLRTAHPTNRLYRNNGASSEPMFTDVTEVSKAGDTGYGLGCAVGDFDNDGFPDLYVTNFGPNVLYRNNGNGTFADVTARAGVGDERMGSSAAFFDYDRDGSLDLYVTNYVTWDLTDDRFCSLRGLAARAYCHPDVFPGSADVLYHNNGDGTFTDVTRAAGVYREEGKGLGIVVTDYDADGDPDIYVAEGSASLTWIETSPIRMPADGGGAVHSHPGGGR